MNSFCFRPLMGLSVALAAISLGCRPQDTITTYEVPKAEAIQLPAAKPSTGGDSESIGEPQRMLGAIILHKDQFWFLKLTGAIDAVAAKEAEFKQVVQSITFNEAGEPKWELPGGWSQQPASGMRFATLTVGEDPKLETSVTVLPSGGGDAQEGVLANLNRWRNQLGLPPIKVAQLAKESEELALPNGQTAVYVNLTGTAKPTGMGGPFAGGRGGLDRPFAPPTPAAPSVAASTDIKLTAPPEWKPGKVGGMRKAAYVIEGAAGSGEVTIIDLSRGAGDRKANVNRWAGQIGLSALDDAGLKAALKPIEVGSLTGDYIVLIPPPEAEKGQAILGVIADKGDKTWFIKLQAPTAIAMQEKTAFEAFVKSVELP